MTSTSENHATTLTLTGTCEAGSTVKVYNGTTPMGNATVTGTTWTYTGSVGTALDYDFKVKVEVPVKPATSSVVVFDYVEGVCSSHSNRTFDANVDYTIYIRVHSKSTALSTAGNEAKGLTFGSWLGGNTLGKKDKLILVGNGSPVMQSTGPGGGHDPITGVATRPIEGGIFYWKPAQGSGSEFGNCNSVRGEGAELIRCGTAQGPAMWTGQWASIPNQGLTLNQVYLTEMPAGVLTSQGLV